MSPTDGAIVLPDGRLLGYREYGDPVGTPVFSFHGWPGSRIQSARYDAVARTCGLRIIAPDRPGYGLSDSQPGRTMRDWPKDVSVLADRLGLDRFGVLGVSGGGPYALACARWIPERLTSVAIVSGLGLAIAECPDHSGGRLSRLVTRGLWTSSITTRTGLWLASVAVRANAGLALRWAAKVLPPCDYAVVTSPAFHAIATEDMTEALNDGGRAASSDFRVLTRAWGFALEDITVPVYLWHGEDDRIVACSMGRHVAASLPDCRATFLPAEGHYAVVPRAEEILRVLMC